MDKNTLPASMPMKANNTKDNNNKDSNSNNNTRDNNNKSNNKDSNSNNRDKTLTTSNSLYSLEITSSSTSLVMNKKNNKTNNNHLLMSLNNCLMSFPNNNKILTPDINLLHKIKSINSTKSLYNVMITKTNAPFAMKTIRKVK